MREALEGTLLAELEGGPGPGEELTLDLDFLSADLDAGRKGA